MRALLLALLVLAPVLRAAPDDVRRQERLSQLSQEFRRLAALPEPNAIEEAERRRALEQIAALQTPQALQFLAQLLREPRMSPFHHDVLQLMAEHYRDNNVALGIFREVVKGPEGPSRMLARRILLQHAVERQDDDFLVELFRRGDDEERFMALEALGRIASPVALGFAEELLADDSWAPKPEAGVNCGTIARAMEWLEGPRAARILLLLGRDARFTHEDAAAVREATRLWRQPDLVSHIRIADLADPDPERRAEAALFLGRMGIEAARAPLLHLARRPHEPGFVRAAAVEGLGGLKIARDDMADTIAAFLDDAEPRVRRAAVEGLAKLRVRRAVRILASLPPGPARRHALAALSREFDLPESSDWLNLVPPR